MEPKSRLEDLLELRREVEAEIDKEVRKRSVGKKVYSKYMPYNPKRKLSYRNRMRLTIIPDENLIVNVEDASQFILKPTQELCIRKEAWDHYTLLFREITESDEEGE